MIKSKPDDHQKIIFADYSGEIRLKDISDFYAHIAYQYPNWENLRLVQDERNAEFIESHEIIDNAKKLIQILSAPFKSIKIAVVQDRPVQTAYGYLFLESTSMDNYLIRIFYNAENALNWVKE